jgi:tetratricopeptide (TPR) repeat protein
LGFRSRSFVSVTLPSSFSSSSSSSDLSRLCQSYLSCDFPSVLNNSKAFQSLVHSSTPSSPSSLLSSLSSNLSASLICSSTARRSLEFEYFLLGLSCLHLFIQANFTGPPLSSESFHFLSPSDSSSLFHLLFSSSCNSSSFTCLLSEAGEDFHESFRFQCFFLLSRFLLLDSLSNYAHLPVSIPWWGFRLCEIHAQAMETQANSIKVRANKFIQMVKNNFKFNAFIEEKQENFITDHSFSSSDSSFYPSFPCVSPSSLSSFLSVHSSSPVFSLLQSLFLLEVSRYHQRYWRGDLSGLNLEAALKVACLSVETTGIMGNRTKYQVEKKAQLILKVQNNQKEETKSIEEAKQGEIHPISPFSMSEDAACSEVSAMPKDLQLNSDVLLEEWALDEKLVLQPLSVIHRALLLAKFDHFRSNQPTAHISIKEEMLAYLYRILVPNSERSWIIESTALFHRSLLESKDFHKQDRALQQLEELGRITQIELKPLADPLEADQDQTQFLPSFDSSISASPAVIRTRICDFFYSGFSSNFHLRLSIAQLFESMKFRKSALQLYESILYWDGIIELSIGLGRKTRAEQFIQQQRKVYGDTPKLLCLLGDLTENSDYYEQAWGLSKQSYPRAQRSLAKLKRTKEQFQEAIHHYQLALSLNPVFPSEWFALGFCCLQVKDYDLASTAFARTVALDPEYGDAWNNLAVSHLSLKHYRPAYQALEHALKCQFDSWKLWENYLLTAIQLKEYQTALTALEKVWELKGNAFSVAKAVAEGKKASEIVQESNKVKEKQTESNANAGGLVDTPSSAHIANDSTDTLSNVLDPDILSHLITAVELNIAVEGRENNFLLQKLSKIIHSIRNKGNLLYSPQVYRLFSRALALNQEWNEALMELERAQRESSGNSSVWTNKIDSFTLAAEITSELGELYLKFPTSQNIYAGKVLLASFISKIEKSIAENSPIRTERKELIQKLKEIYEKLKAAGPKEEQKTSQTSGSSFAASMGGSSYLANNMWR